MTSKEMTAHEAYPDIFNEDGSWKNNPLVFEWVAWFRDNTLMSQYNQTGIKGRWHEAVKYAKNVSPFWRIAWLPYSPEKRNKINTMEGHNLTEAVNSGAHILECDNIDPDKVHMTRRNAFVTPLGPLAHPARHTFYVMGIETHTVKMEIIKPNGETVIQQVPHGAFTSIDGVGNTRIGLHLHVTVPVIPIRQYVDPATIPNRFLEAEVVEDDEPQDT